MVIFINQLRMKIGVMYGNPETTTGGNALKFYASMRLDIRRIGQIKEAATSDKKDPVSIGNRTRVKVVKNKMAPPFREVEFDILYGQGISRSGDIIDLATDLGLVEKSGAWFSCGTERIGQGRENAKAYLESHPELMERLESQILAKHNIKRGNAGGAEEPVAGGSAKPAGAGGAGGTAGSAKGGEPAAKADVAPDGKPVVRIPASTSGAPDRPAKNGAAPDDGKANLRGGATKPAN
jgi:recombination protein RecA